MEILIKVNEEDNFVTYGGEIDTKDVSIDDYGIQIGELKIENITSYQLKQLVRGATTHLIQNGHTLI